MKAFRNKTLVFLLLLTLLLTACGGNRTTDEKRAEAEYAGTNISYTSDLSAQSENSGMSGNDSLLPSSQKLIKKLFYTFESKEFDKSLGVIRQLTAELGGYIESSSVSGQSYKRSGARTAEFVLRIPADKTGDFEAKAAEIGNNTSLREEVEDISLQYADTASKVQSLETQRDRLLAMMEEAEDLQDLLTIQDHLTQVEYELESYTSQLRVLENLVAYTTATITLYEVETLTEAAPKTFGEKLGEKFSGSLKRVGEFFTDAALFLVGNLPSILTAAAAVVLIVFGIRIGMKKHKVRKEKKLQEAFKKGMRLPEQTPEEKPNP
ncbi:MAG: DUF4349 domain-containing protein [Lachnospiraceae bacterium]|nr:DUF4349 domain-containing protein [Lachnospiraceae bacterium]